MTEIYGANTAIDRRDVTGEVESRKVANIRFGAHNDERFDRVVFDISAGGDLGWSAAYVDGEPAQQGSGEPVDVPGDEVLEVMLQGMDWTNTDIDEYDGGPQDPDGKAVVSIRYEGSFEGYTQVFIGTTGRVPFRVATIEGDSPRIYIDFAHV